MAKVKKIHMTTDAGEDMEKNEYSYIADGIANWHKHFGNQSGGSSEGCKQFYLKWKLYHSSAYSQKILHHITMIHAQLFS